jgi:hypothetical protein
MDFLAIGKGRCCRLEKPMCMVDGLAKVELVPFTSEYRFFDRLSSTKASDNFEAISVELVHFVDGYFGWIVCSGTTITILFIADYLRLEVEWCSTSSTTDFPDLVIV